ncbi:MULTISPECIES: biosynthetic-type acetolactate synthase large subunit [Fusobacterium]|jgi:acetolactate synthase, large subunit, biosynthetic type|uniref:Acetolactate synthase n=1 Tax=Fusobacterium nucleatum subsp. polymorphum TaxID=76857 RepID=A0A2C6ASU0_FUSNP|nr:MULTISPECIES: biosynthetic-type acetolactate synthase large subunit [Fusobacterium]EUB18585.1 acetolactate synthase, large subunit, biosynthetic type [Fusobacterium sp. CM22]PHH99187.1 acetolactate synthase, large subunit, biosynthetic type [Fusobacterium polymorphum]PHI07384.1 acetolactate synthase, large subunit, biosynthetic type [Fusobacterium polymorphum]PHI14960.1 acetolactate synthase, large subunit, biosynthetic type [Fusobacterium polymorphum]WCB32044.1 biosynthetic-type acetolacta
MANEKMIKGARILLECLSRLGINEIFGYPGGAVIPIYDELYSFKEIKHYFARHEQGAVHEADGYARSTGKVGACLATSGPGATNLVTGIMTAHMDSIPLLVITGQVSSSLLGKDAFQESDIVGITVPITKNNYLVQDIKDLPRILKEAYYIASTGRPGPVLVDIPRDIQLQEIPYDEFNKIYENHFSLEGYNPVYEGHKGQIKTAIKMIKDSKKPLIIAGAGILKAHAYEELKEFVEKTNIPVAMTLLGLGSFPGNHELALGMIGMHGTTYANYAANEADLIIAAGMRFDDRVTGNPQKFVPNAKIIHIDIDPAEIGKNKLIDVPIVGDLKNVLTDLNEKAPKVSYDEWLKQIKKWKKEYSLTYRKTEDDILIPQEILSEIDKITKGNVIVATDVGQHQMWAAQYLTFNNPYSILTSGGAGTMGFGLPAAIGAQVANPNKKVLAVVGDGGFQMTFQELMLIKEYNLPVKIFIINNSYLGMVRQWQELFHEKRYSSVDLSYNPDFIKIGEAYGIKSIQLTNKKDLKKHLKKILESDEAVLVECIVEKEENVYPMIPAGKDVSCIVGKRGVLENE